MGLVNEGLNLIVCPLCSPLARASEQVQFIPEDRLPAGLLRPGNVFHPVFFLLMITDGQLHLCLFMWEISKLCPTGEGCLLLTVTKLYVPPSNYLNLSANCNTWFRKQYMLNVFDLSQCEFT